MPNSLVICVGNPARGDDGVAHEVARSLRARDGFEAEVVDVHALDVVLAERAATAQRLVIVDAIRREEPPVTISPVTPATTAPGAHTLDAAGLLGLVTSLYGATPRTWLVAVAAPEMPHSESLSAVAEEAAKIASDAVAALVARHDEGSDGVSAS